MIENSRTMKIKSIIFILNIEKKESFYNSYNNVYIALDVMMQTILKNNIFFLDFKEKSIYTFLTK